MLALDVKNSIAGRAEGVSKLPGCEVIGTFLLRVSLKDNAEMLFRWAIGKLLGPSN